jgi:hypothetical protein
MECLVYNWRAMLDVYGSADDTELSGRSDHIWICVHPYLDTFYRVSLLFEPRYSNSAMTYSDPIHTSCLSRDLTLPYVALLGLSGPKEEVYRPLLPHLCSALRPMDFRGFVGVSR